MTTLGAMLSEWREIEEEIDLADGEVTEGLEQRLTALDLSLPEKVDAYGFVIDKFAAEAEFFKNKAKEFSDKARSYESTGARIKQRLKELIIISGKTTLEGNHTKFRISECSPTMDIYDRSILPEQFTYVVTSVEINKTLLKDTLKTRTDIPGARLIGGTALRQTLIAKLNKGASNE